MAGERTNLVCTKCAGKGGYYEDEMPRQGKEPVMIGVLGTARHYKDWSEEFIAPPGVRFFNIYRMEHIRGARFDGVIRLSSWHQLQGYPTLWSAMLTRVS